MKNLLPWWLCSHLEVLDTMYGRAFNTYNRNIFMSFSTPLLIQPHSATER